MNRLFIYISIFIFLISCSSKKEGTTTDIEVENQLSKTKTSEIPVFKDSLTTKYVKEYTAFVDDYLSAVKNGDRKKIEQLQEQSLELVEKAKLVSGKLETDAELSRYQEWLTQQQKKINTLNN